MLKGAINRAYTRPKDTDRRTNIMQRAGPSNQKVKARSAQHAGVRVPLNLAHGSHAFYRLARR